MCLSYIRRRVMVLSSKNKPLKHKASYVTLHISLDAGIYLEVSPENYNDDVGKARQARWENQSRMHYLVDYYWALRLSPARGPSEEPCRICILESSPQWVRSWDISLPTTVSYSLRIALRVSSPLHSPVCFPWL